MFLKSYMIFLAELSASHFQISFAKRCSGRSSCGSFTNIVPQVYRQYICQIGNLVFMRVRDLVWVEYAMAALSNAAGEKDYSSLNLLYATRI